ncbi:MAG: hypothetical protein GEU26_01675 [Nitrososphaeraceae archaeon]|nr:hypothetical protein [Nitrososphaeraceae archaeon]
MDNLSEHRKLARKRIIHHARLTGVIKQIPLTTDNGKSIVRQVSIPMIKGISATLTELSTNMQDWG